MSETGIRVEQEGLHSLQAALATASSEMSKALQQLEGDVATLRGRWSGDAQQAYDSAHARWTDAMATISQLLAEIGVIVGDSAEGYDAAEQANAERWSVG